jgi:xylulokinase
VARAAQEGIVFAMYYGVEIMQEMGLQVNKVRAGYANMFLSDVFAEAFANTTGCVVEMYNTDGAIGAARAAGVGAGIFSDHKESFRGLELVKKTEPDPEKVKAYGDAYANWKEKLEIEQ